MEKLDALLEAISTWTATAEPLSPGLDVSPAWLWAFENWRREDHCLGNVIELVDSIHAQFLATGNVELFAHCIDVYQFAMQGFSHFYPETEAELLGFFVGRGTRVNDLSPEQSARITWKRCEAAKGVFEAAGIKSQTAISVVFSAPEGESVYDLPWTNINIEDFKKYAGGDRVAVARLFADMMEATMPYYHKDEFWEKRRQMIKHFREAAAKWTKEG